MTIAGSTQFGFDWVDIEEVVGKTNRVSRGLWLFPIYLTLNVRVPLQNSHINVGWIDLNVIASESEIIHTAKCCGRILI